MDDVYYNASPHVVSRSIAGETILVPVAGETANLESIYGLNELGELIWKLLGEKRSVKEIVQSIVDSYKVDRAEAEKDVVEFLTALESRHLIEKSTGREG